VFFQIKGPPGEPSFTVRVDNEPSRAEELIVLRAGQTVQLRCTARGGNPIPTLTFSRNGLSFGPGPRPYQNTHTFVATSGDHEVVLSCSAANQADRHASSLNVQLNVLCKYCMFCMEKDFLSHDPKNQKSNNNMTFNFFLNI
jgi:hypothetical protein